MDVAAERSKLVARAPAGKRTGKQLFPVATVLNGKRVARA